jgi:hypothetical protein
MGDARRDPGLLDSSTWGEAAAPVAEHAGPMIARAHAATVVVEPGCPVRPA